MLITANALIAAAMLAAAAAPAKLPTDIHPQSRSRLPPIQRDKLNDEGKRVYDYVRGANPTLGTTGPGAVTIYSPGVAEPFQQLNQYLRKTVVGPRIFEMCTLIAAYEYKQGYEWTGHEPAAVRAGVEPAVLEVIRNDKPTKGLPEKDAAVIDFGRSLLRGNRQVSPELWAKMVGYFGQQGVIEIATIVGDYVMAAIVLNAANQLPMEGRESTLPWR
jgi:4-carboxymuconolactone decarboxylase